MRKVWKTYPDDGDVGALTGQALMLLHRKGSWTHEGEPQPGTDAVIQTLKTVIAKHPQHPYALHLLVHVVEASPHPEWADQAADRLRDMAPGLGHLTHMPTHIDIRRGRWQEAVVASEKAVSADRVYRQLAENPGLYCRILMAHDNHMLAYAAAMQGAKPEGHTGNHGPAGRPAPQFYHRTRCQARRVFRDALRTAPSLRSLGPDAG